VLFTALVIPLPGPDWDLYAVLSITALGLGAVHGLCYLYALRGRL
jgi:hypothetical protein